METNISLVINRKSDIAVIQQKIIESKIDNPVYIFEYEFHYLISFKSDYEEWELDTAILNYFPDYEYTTDLERGEKEIRIKISRYQSELTTDGWGLDETKYLVKKSVDKVLKFNPMIKVLFEDHEQYYYVNIVSGISDSTNTKGFLLLDEFKIDDEEADFFKDKLYSSPIEAFHSARNKMEELVEMDFDIYRQAKKKKIRETQKLPRKIIRDFITACNNSDEVAILKKIDHDIIYEKVIDCRALHHAEGIIEFEKSFILKTKLIGNSIKIRSWDIKLPYITLDIKYYLSVPGYETDLVKKYALMKFIVKGDKIAYVSDDIK